MGMWRAWWAVAICPVFASAIARGAPTPLPPERPPELRSPLRKPPQLNEPARGERADEAREDCLARLDESGVKYQPVASQEEGACLIATPIRLEGMAAGRNASGPISFPARPLIDCMLAERLADWLRQAVSPLLSAEFSASLKSVATGAGYECRTRNREPGAKLSAHALGLALDISAFDLTDRREVKVGAADNDEARKTFSVIRRSACGWFTTVLGPGSEDHLHESHLHVDIQPHGSTNSYHICE